MSNKETNYKTLNIDSDILAKARNGDAISQLLLGKAYFCAVYNEDNCLNAFKWIYCSAEQGNMEAQFRLADLFALGQGAPKRYKDAYEWYTKAALQGYKKASIRIFNLFQQDRKMCSRGRLHCGENKWTDSKFKEENNIRELNEYRLKHYESKLNYAIDYYTELFNVLKSGNQEDPITSFKLGFLYQYGYGVKKCIKLAIDYYKEAADHGSRDAQYHLGYLYENGTDIKFNYRLAIHWYRTSATSGNIAAQNALGYFYEKGLATELNFGGAVYWYTKAANAGNLDAQLTLGKLYRKGEGVEVDISQAIKWYTLAASQGSGAAQNCLNQLYQLGKIAQLSGIENNTGYVGEHQTKPTLRSKLQDDIEKMSSLPNITQLKKLAEHALRTDGNAMFTLGMKYFNGEDFTQDKEAGFQWMKKAAKTGLQEAEMKVSKMYENGGDVVDQDYHESSIWIAKVVKQRNSVAQCDLGLLYLHGKGVRKDPLEASKWFTKSADQGNAEAQCQFGLLRLEGLGLRKDTEEALECFNKSALNGNVNALLNLGEFYEGGKYIKKDVSRAIKFYEYSAKNGNLDSQIKLAEIYEKGELVDQNLQKAEKYYRLAAKSFDDSHRYKLAQKYMEGAFGKSNYTKALDLFINIAVENPSSRFNILRTPIPDEAVFRNYSRMMDMFKSARGRRDVKIHYNIGYIYENGIHNDLKKMYYPPTYTDARHWYSEALFMNGDFRVWYRLGLMYEEGKGVEIDLDEAYDYYLEAYENGIDDAAYRLALMYMSGKGVAQNLVKAYCLFTEVSNKGNKEANKEMLPSKDSDNLKMLEAVGGAGYVAVQYQLGVFYHNQNTNDQQAIKWLTLAAENGVTDAYYRLGVIHEALKGNDQSYSKAIHYYSVAVERDYEDAMYRLARIYHLDGRVMHDYQKAYDLYSRAAELGHTESSRILNFTKHSIGYSYTKDETTIVKYSEGLENTLLMIESLAATGDVHLQYQLGTFYISNKKHSNYNEAFKWFQMAASKEHTDAIYQLGLLYENGKGTRKNHNKAYHLYIQAKEKGHPDATYRLGVAHQYGLGTIINSSKSIAYYIEAAGLGNNESQYKLGKLYSSGELVGKDLLKALVWYTKAYLNGNCDAHRDLYQLYNDEPIESYFYHRLFNILSTLEHSYQSDADKYDYSIRQCYGLMYFKFGLLYLNGQGTAENLTEALKKLLKSYYDYQYLQAKSFISLEYNQHEVSSQSIYLAKLKIYLEIQDQIPSEHQYHLGVLYYNGIQDVSINHNISDNRDLTTVLAPDYSIAFRYFYLASKNGYFKAQKRIELMYLCGQGVERDYQNASKLLTTVSESMTATDCFFKGHLFYYGSHVEQDYRIAALFFQKAVEKNHSEAQTYLDLIYLNEIEKEQHKSQTMGQVEKRIEKITPNLLYSRGVELYKGTDEGVKNHGLSFLYIKTAAEKNYDQAISQLVTIYLEGKAVEKDENEALKWAEKSIEVMDTNECYEQGLDYYSDKNYRISLLYMKKAAEENNGHAQYYLGLMYIQGLGVEKNYEQAVGWFKRSTTQLASEDCEEKGMEFYKRVELDNNYEIAQLYLRKTAEGNDPLIQANLAIMYLQGLGIERNYNKAKEWIKSSIKNMDKSCCYDYGMIFRNGIEVEKNYTISLAFLRKAANQSYGLAQAQLGLMYLNGNGVRKNESEGMKLIKESLKNMKQYECYEVGIHLYNHHRSEIRFRVAMIFIKQAAEEGYGLAQAHLGEIYLDGKGVQKNQNKALKWIEKSVKELAPSQCFDQGMKYYSGVEVERNYRIAMLYLQEAEPKNHSLAQVQIGIMYLKGHGVKKSKEKAMRCFQKSINKMDHEDCYFQGIVLYNEYIFDISFLYIKNAAEAGYSKAQSQLGIMLIEGKTTQKSQVQAMEWIEKSMESMNPGECYDQGMALYRGTIVIKDYAISFRFMEKAAENHYGLSQAHLALVYLQGFAVEKNMDESIKWVEKSLQYLSPDECYEQGMKFYNGTEVHPDYEICLLYLRKAAEHHHGLTLAQLALMYLEGTGVEKNYGTAMELIQKSMNEMKLNECYRQGMIFYHKTALENNYGIALQYLKRASKANAYAQAQLGYMYLNGIGVDQSHEEADRWLNIVENNYAGESRFCRSKIYHYDQGGMQDFSKALKLYQEELEAFFHYSKPPNISGSLRGIGLLHEYGDGVFQDFKKALTYYRRSASGENMAAYYNIGLLYYYGKGAEQNYKEALIWFTKVVSSTPDHEGLHIFIEDNGRHYGRFTSKISKKSNFQQSTVPKKIDFSFSLPTEKGTTNVTGLSKRTYSLQPENRIYGEAHYYIGLMYNNGFGVDQDKDRAQNYFKMAHIHGIERAKKILYK